MKSLKNQNIHIATQNYPKHPTMSILPFGAMDLLTVVAIDAGGITDVSFEELMAHIDPHTTMTPVVGAERVEEIIGLSLPMRVSGVLFTESGEEKKVGNYCITFRDGMSLTAYMRRF